MDMPDSRERIKAKLEMHGVNVTLQRIEIGCVLLNRPQHLSAEQVIERLRARGSRVSKATVYNTLNLFVSQGLVRAITLDPSRIFYDSNSAPHHHFYNVDTGELTDIPPAAVEIRGLPSLPAGTAAESVHVIVQVRNAASQQG
jgi:Fur family iron response transcriptional regulator